MTRLAGTEDATVSCAAAWSALADRFAAVADESPIEFSTYPEDTTAFNWEVIRSRVLFRFWPNEYAPAERVLSIRADDPDPFTRRRRVNRFRWLCWAAGVLLDPHACYRCGEVVWLNHVTGGNTELITDVTRPSADAARLLAQRGISPHSAPPVVHPQLWPNQRAKFALYAERFASPRFHGTELHVTVGQRQLPGDDAPDPDRQRFDWAKPGSCGGLPRRLIYSVDGGGTMWGDEHAVHEFKAIAEAANRALLSELTIGMGPPLFPPTDFSRHTSLAHEWDRWAVAMWLLSPTDFTIEIPTAHTSPVITLNGCAEAVAAGVCRQLAATEDCQAVKREARLQLAKSNPWLTHEDRTAARQAVDAAYRLPAGGIAIVTEAGRNRTPKHNRGRPPATKTNPERVKSDTKLFRDWKETGVSDTEFLRDRGIGVKLGKLALRRGRHHAGREDNNSAN